MVKPPLLFALLLTAFVPLAAEQWVPPIDQSDYNPLDSGLMILEGSHIIRNKAPGGEMLALEDGSLFLVGAGYESTVSYWKVNEPVKLSVIKPHLFGSTTLYLTSIYDESYTPVELVKGPHPDASITSKIFHMDNDAQTIYIRDGQEHETLWQINEKDLTIIQSWQLGDRVCIGINDSWGEWILGAQTFFLLNYDLLIQGEETFFLPVTKLANDYE